MTEATHTTVFRNEYTAPDYSVDSIDLRFELGDEVTVVTSRMSLRAAYDATSGARPLVSLPICHPRDDGGKCPRCAAR